jgi:hypothetical protein
MPLPPCALISSTRALSGPLFKGSILTGMHLQRSNTLRGVRDVC